MKLTIKGNKRINKVKVNKGNNDEIYGIVIDFEPSDIWCDLEMWLNNSSDEFLDHAALNISKRNKLQFHK